MITTLSLSASLLNVINLVETETKSANLTWLYFHLQISVQIFCILLCSIVLHAMVFCNRFIFKHFVLNVPTDYF